jgi:hypothetical protein
MELISRFACTAVEALEGCSSVAEVDGVAGLNDPLEDGPCFGAPAL